MEVVPSFNPKEQKSSKLSLLTLIVGGCSLVMGLVAVVLRWGKFSKVSSVRHEFEDPYKDTGFFTVFSKPCEFHPRSGGSATFCGAKVQFVPHPLLKFSGVCMLVSLALSLLFCVFALLGFAMEVQNKNICLKYLRSVTATLVLAVLMELAMLASVALGVLQFIQHSTGKNEEQYKVSLGGGYIIAIILTIFNILLLVMSINRFKRAKNADFPKELHDPSIYVIPEPDPSRPRLKPALRESHHHCSTLDNGPQNRIRQPIGVLSMDPRTGSINSCNMSTVSDNTSIISIGSAGSLQSNWSGRSGASNNSVKFSIKSEQTTL